MIGHPVHQPGPAVDRAVLNRAVQRRADLIGGQAAIGPGRLLPAMEPWARDLGKANMAQLTAFLEAAQPIAALSGTQTQGKPPAGAQATGATGANGLTAEEQAVCSSMGLSPEQFLKAKA